MNKELNIGLLIIGFVLLVSIFAKYLAPYEPDKQNLLERLQKPSVKHILGTDDLGRDVLSRLIYASRISLSVGIISVGIAIVIGLILGLIAGYYGGIVDNLIMRLVDIMLCFPTFFLILMVIAFLKPSIFNIMIVIGLTSWPSLARYIRGEVLSVREREYITSLKIAGYSVYRILFVHILPNVIVPVIITFTFGVGGAILTESALSFLGLGVQPPDPSWGNILTLGKDYIHFAWWLSVFPGMAILVTVMGFNFIGEGLRNLLDPKKR